MAAASMSEQLDIQTAMYFEGRARRTRSGAQRGRYLAAAKKYRDLATRRRESTSPAPANTDARKSP
jgi:hypothetical protein